MRDRLRSLLESRFRISMQLYLGIGGAVVLTVAASLVGWFSFNRVGEVQSRVNEGSVPEVVASFGVAQYSGALVAAAPRLISAATPEEFDRVSASISEAHTAFEDQLAVLEEKDGGEERFRSIRAYADTLILNVQDIKGEMSQLFDFGQRSTALQTELAELRARLEDILVPAIDDQLFYTVTGFRSLDEPPRPRSEHFSGDELVHYRHLAELQADANLATQLLTSAFTLADASTVEPLRERFESTAGRIERSLAALEGSSLHAEVAPLFTRLVELGTGEESGFDLIEDELRLAEQQRGLLALNRDIAVDLVAEVDGLVNAAHASAQEATEASSEAIFTGSTLLLGISALSIAGAVLIAWLFVGRVLLRRLQRLSDWMLRMAGGDLEARVDIGGRDEVADMAAALEVFRRHALEVQRLNLVEKLADELQGKNEQLESVLADLRKAQDQIVTREKLAALGELTAGVAHEIRNPLNFVKNFSEASEELVDELKEILEDASEAIGDEDKEMIEEISQDLTGNMERIRSHGERADRIVNDMLMMGRGSAGAQATDINRLLEEHARLAYHSARGTDDEFQLDLKFDLDPEVGEIEVIPQDMGRVFLNMVSNAGYASNERRSEGPPSATDDFLPTLWLTTRRKEDRIVVSIRDNGSGIPPDVLDKIFNPFFTTKPTDQGTGLGLAISNDIVREHGGAIRVNTEVGEGTEMIVELPLMPSAALQEGAAEPDGAADSGVSIAGPMSAAPEAPPA